jgi:ABC-2 type transport system permease protein
MNLLLIMIKEIKHNVRNWKANIMMVLFPLILIVILGAAFSGVFDKTVTLDDIKVLYNNRGDGALSEGFNVFARELGKSGGVAFERTDSIEAGKKGVSEGEYSAYIVVDDKGGKIDIYENDRYSFNANLVQSMVEAFARKYGAISAVAAVRPSVVGEIISRGYESYTALRSVDRNRQPGSLDYYSVTMLTLIILYASLTGFWTKKIKKLPTDSPLIFDKCILPSSLLI